MSLGISTWLDWCVRTTSERICVRHGAVPCSLRAVVTRVLLSKWREQLHKEETFLKGTYRVSVNLNLLHNSSEIHSSVTPFGNRIVNYCSINKRSRQTKLNHDLYSSINTYSILYPPPKKKFKKKSLKLYPSKNKQARTGVREKSKVNLKTGNWAHTCKVFWSNPHPILCPPMPSLFLHHYFLPTLCF